MLLSCIKRLVSSPESAERLAKRTCDGGSGALVSSSCDAPLSVSRFKAMRCSAPLAASVLTVSGKNCAGGEPSGLVSRCAKRCGPSQSAIRKLPLLVSV